MSQQWTVRAVLDWTKEYFRRKGIASARLEAEILLAHALQTERLALYLDPQRPLTEPERDTYKDLIRQRYKGTPLQYLIGLIDFYDCKIKVSPACLIPRPETEELVELIVADWQDKRQHTLRILDLGTGTGAIAIALARTFRQAQVLAVDISSAALEIARENAIANGVNHRVVFLRSDWYECVSGQFDLIVSNPPYIAQEELIRLQAEVQQEPLIALNGGRTGLDSIASIIQKSSTRLSEAGPLYLEIGHNQGPAVFELFKKMNAYQNIAILRDLSGKERFARALRASAQNSVAQSA